MRLRPIASRRKQKAAWLDAEFPFVCATTPWPSATSVAASTGGRPLLVFRRIVRYQGPSDQSLYIVTYRANSVTTDDLERQTLLNALRATKIPAKTGREMDIESAVSEGSWRDVEMVLDQRDQLVRAHFVSDAVEVVVGHVETGEMYALTAIKTPLREISLITQDPSELTPWS